MSASLPFKNLRAARRKGWSVRCENVGPSDWVHYGAFIRQNGKCVHFMSDTDAMWSLGDARRHALEWINEREAENPTN